jgi:hypothetical protein
VKKAISNRAGGEQKRAKQKTSKKSEKHTRSLVLLNFSKELFCRPVETQMGDSKLAEFIFRILKCLRYQERIFISHEALMGTLT